MILIIPSFNLLKVILSNMFLTQKVCYLFIDKYDRINAQSR